MAESKSVRLNDADDPDRQEKFNRTAHEHAVNGNATLRHLVDAWLRFVHEHGHPPKFPVRLVSLTAEKKKR